MDDLLLFYDENTETSEQYFLGCLVIAKENNRWAVIDGQQRLTTLSLAIKAIFNRSQENRGLELMLKKWDSVKGEVLDELRLTSEVLDEDKENFKQVLLGDGSPQAGNKFSENLECIQNALDKNSDIRNGGEGLRKFIRMLQDRVVLLPIECDSRDGALKIFQTLNDRGMPLNDSDIFKARMYGKLLTTKDKDNFVKMWNKLGEGNQDDFRKFVGRLFAVSTTHVLRAAVDEKKPDKGRYYCFAGCQGLLGGFGGFYASAAKPPQTCGEIKVIQRRFDAMFFQHAGCWIPAKLSLLFVASSNDSRNWSCTRNFENIGRLPKRRIVGYRFADFNVHDFDMLRFLTGATIKNIHARGGAKVCQQQDGIDTTLLSMELAGGVFASVHCCRQSGRGYDQRVEILAQKGMLIFAKPQQQRHRHRQQQRQNHSQPSARLRRPIRKLLPNPVARFHSRLPKQR